jgi:GT2 family glycosyltransferase
MKSISVVIPNYNGKILLEHNLPFVYLALESSGITDYEIIIPDDGSTDNSVEFIRTHYPDIIVLEHRTNRGFAGNSNSGIFRSDKELVFLLNSDVELTEFYFLPLMKYFDKPDTFGVMSRIIALHSDTVQDAAKYPEYSFGNIISTINYQSTTQTTLYTLFLSGANSLIAREKLIELGGFDELFNPYYSEDVDLGLRAWRLGYKCYYDNDAICRHPNSATISKEQPNKVKIISKRNKMYLHFIHLNNSELCYFLAVLLIKSFLRLLLLDFNYVQSFYMFITTIKQCSQSKNKLAVLQKMKHQTLRLRNVYSIIEQSARTSSITKF